MTNLPDTSTREGQIEATAMIARLMPDLFIVNPAGLVRVAHDDWGFAFFDVNLYTQRDMHLAWRVLNYVSKPIHENPRFHGIGYDVRWHLVPGKDDPNVFQLPPVEAMRTWLDKILELMIDEGLVPTAAGGVA